MNLAAMDRPKQMKSEGGEALSAFFHKIRIPFFVFIFHPIARREITNNCNNNDCEETRHRQCASKHNLENLL